MAAYVISDVRLRDPTLVERYRAIAQDAIARYGGRYIVRGGAVEAVEGGWTPGHIVIVEFPSNINAAAANSIQDKNVTSIALEVHKDCLTAGTDPVIGAWTT